MLTRRRSRAEFIRYNILLTAPSAFHYYSPQPSITLSLPTPNHVWLSWPISTRAHPHYSFDLANFPSARHPADLRGAPLHRPYIHRFRRWQQGELRAQQAAILWQHGGELPACAQREG